MPGKAFAKVLRDVLSGESPVVSYWKQALIVSDNRIPAMDSDTSTYAFAAPVAGGVTTVNAELRFRRVFQGVMDAKGWNRPDIIMEETSQRIALLPVPSVYLPMVTGDIASR